MRAICPICSYRYDSNQKPTSKIGGKVQCANCGHTWLQTSKPSLVLKPQAITSIPPVNSSSSDSSIPSQANSTQSTTVFKSRRQNKTLKKAQPSAKQQLNSNNKQKKIFDILRYEATYANKKQKNNKPSYTPKQKSSINEKAKKNIKDKPKNLSFTLNQMTARSVATADKKTIPFRFYRPEKPKSALNKNKKLTIPKAPEYKTLTKEDSNDTFNKNIVPSSKTNKVKKTSKNAPQMISQSKLQDSTPLPPIKPPSTFAYILQQSHIEKRKKKKEPRTVLNKNSQKSETNSLSKEVTPEKINKTKHSDSKKTVKNNKKISNSSNFIKKFKKRKSSNNRKSPTSITIKNKTVDSVTHKSIHNESRVKTVKPGKEIFGDVEELQSTLKMDIKEDQKLEIDMPKFTDNIGKSNQAFLNGFYTGCALVMIGTATYILEPNITGAIPASKETLNNYTIFIDDGRRVLQNLYTEGKGDPGLVNFFNNTWRVISTGN